MTTSQVKKIAENKYEIKLVPGTKEDLETLRKLPTEDLEYQYNYAITSKLGKDFNLLSAIPIKGEEFAIVGIVRKAKGIGH